jgi:Holliday junction resolvase RusA-like endonuclease
MKRQELSFHVRGTEPGPQGSKRYLGVSSNGKPRFVEASDKVAPFRAAVADAVFREIVATGDDRWFTEPVVVWATFYVPKPPTVKRFWPSVAPDLDKYCRSLGDGLEQNAHVLESDSLIVKWVAVKVYAPVPEDIGVRVTIKTVDRIMQDNGFVTNNEMLQFLGNHH